MKRLAEICFAMCVLWQFAQPVRAADGDGVQAELRDAAEQLASFNFQGGYELFSKVCKRVSPPSAEWQKATFGLAMCAWHYTPPDAARVDQARVLFGQIVEKSPPGPIVAQAMISLGRIAELKDYNDDPADLPAARTWYERVIKDYPADPAASEATLWLAGTYIQSLQPEGLARGVQVLEQWLATHPDDKLAGGMWQYAGGAYVRLENFDKAVDCYVKADKAGLLDLGAEHTFYWKVASLAEKKLHNRDLAVEYYTKVITLTPRSGWAYDAAQALRRLGVTPPKVSAGGVAASQPATSQPGGRP